MTESPPLTAPVLVVGVGNILLGDDGIGVRLAQELGQRLLLAGVEVVDGGTLGLSLLPYLAGREVLVVLDAMRNGQPPGTLQWLRWPQGWQGKTRRSVSPPKAAPWSCSTLPPSLAFCHRLSGWGW
ncbi:MAG: hydrogenase maturation protease [Thermoanaerobaculum sp.]